MTKAVNVVHHCSIVVCFYGSIVSQVLLVCLYFPTRKVVNRFQQKEQNS